jgi:hypothetical protein
LYFNAEHTRSLREKDSNLTQVEAMKLAGTKWGSMTEKEKAPYEAKSA